MNMNVKHPYLVDADVNRNDKEIYFGVQLLRTMQKFEYLEIMCSEDSDKIEHFMLLGRDDFISAMLRSGRQILVEIF